MDEFYLNTNLEKQFNLMKEEIKNEIYKDGPILISKLLEMIDNKELVIPDFQRDFVWNLDRFTLLFDSIYRRYTIGSLLLWKTQNKLAHREVGAKDCIKKDQIEDKPEYTYVLDGQQRLTTLYAVLKGKEIYKSGLKNLKSFNIYFDIEEDVFRKGTERLDNGKQLKKAIDDGDFGPFRIINMSQLFNVELNYPENIIKPEQKKLLTKLTNNEIEKEEYENEYAKLEKIEELLKNFKSIFENYKIPQYVDRNPNIEKIVTIFERINTQNMKLDIFDIMVAKTYQTVLFNEAKYTFNLKIATKKILYKHNMTSEQCNPEVDTLDTDSNLYYSVSGTTLLRMIAINIKSTDKIALLKQDIYELTAQEIQNSLKSIRELIIDINNYLNHQLNISEINENLINNNIISFLSYVFTKKKYRESNSEIVNKWLWNTLLFNRYSGSQLQQIESDIKRYNEGEDSFYKRIKEKRNLNLLSHELKVEERNLLNAGYDKINSLLYQSIILLLNKQKPKDFNGKLVVNVSTYIGSNAKNNKHHIIPYNSSDGKEIRKKRDGHKIINNVANIAIISSELNKVILNKNPQDYFKQFESDPNFYEILESHLISKEMYEHLLKKEYSQFLIKRTNKIIEEIKKLCAIEGENINIYGEEDDE